LSDLAAAVTLNSARTVVVGYLDHQEPSVPQAFALLAGCERVRALALLLSEAYHAQVDVPEALATAPPGLVVEDAGTLGHHPLLLEALDRRLAQSGVMVGDPGTSVVLAAAGTSDPAARDAIDEVAVAWKQRGWHDVRAAFATGPGDRPAEVVRELATAQGDGGVRIVVASYLLAPGVLDDRIRQECTEAGAERVSEPIGACPESVRAVMDRLGFAASN
jgi:sirohydrochlorin ferrochelatase